MEDNKNKFSDLRRRARELGEIDRYLFSEQHARDFENGSKISTIEAARKYAIETKGFSVFDEMSESEKVVD